jgi:hypothetical protein
MIESLTVPIADFQLEPFIHEYTRFYRKYSGSDDVLEGTVAMERFGDTPSSCPLEEALSEEQSLVHCLLELGLKVFFMMHEPPADERFLCIDGKRRKSDDLDIGVDDGYGFLVEVDGDTISLHPALYDGSSGPVPRIDLQGTCSILEEPMKAFVAKFVMR